MFMSSAIAGPILPGHLAPGPRAIIPTMHNATALFKLAVANNVHNFVEHRYALLELSLLGQEQDDLAESDQQ